MRDDTARAQTKPSCLLITIESHETCGICLGYNDSDKKKITICSKLHTRGKLLSHSEKDIINLIRTNVLPLFILIIQIIFPWIKFHQSKILLNKKKLDLT